MAEAVKIPVTVKMRAGWDEHQINAPDARPRDGRRGRGRRRRPRPDGRAVLLGFSDWDLIGAWPRAWASPCSAAATAWSREQLIERLRGAPCAACSSGAARCATRGSSSRRDARRRPIGRARSRSRSAASSCSTTSTCCSPSGWRGRRIPARGARAAPAAPRRRADASVGHQQAARAELLVHEGTRQRVAPARGGDQRAESIAELRGIAAAASARPSSRSCRAVSARSGRGRNNTTCAITAALRRRPAYARLPRRAVGPRLPHHRACLLRVARDARLAHRGRPVGDRQPGAGPSRTGARAPTACCRKAADRVGLHRTAGASRRHPGIDPNAPRACDLVTHRQADPDRRAVAGRDPDDATARARVVRRPGAAGDRGDRACATPRAAGVHRSGAAGVHRSGAADGHRPDAAASPRSAAASRRAAP
jgi:hypothetical protein